MGVWYQSCHYKPCNYERENVAFDMVHFLIHETNDCSIILPTSRIFPYDQQYVKEATTFQVESKISHDNNASDEQDTKG